MRDIGHFIGGKAVAGTSGRHADVFEPMTGEVQARVALASKAELRAAVENARAAQPAWGATNPQRRARVMMRFLDLVQRDYDSLAELLAREHGKTIPDAKGDIQRGLEVVEFACGIPHLMKGEYTEGAGPGIDIYSMRQALGVVAGITPFNFPAMIPMWKFGPAIACGNAFILKPSERDPGVPMRLAELMMEAGLPAGILNVVNGDKEAVDAILDDPDIKAVGFVGSSPIAQYIYHRAASTGKRAQCFGGAKNHMIIMPDADMDQAVDALIGAGYGSAGERCMAISVAVPVGKATADSLLEKLIPRVESLKVGPSTDPSADFGPVVTQAALERIKGYVDHGIKEGAKLVVDGRGFKMQGYENGFYMGGCLFDEVTPDMKIYKEEIFGPVLSVVRAKDYCRGAAPSDGARIRQRRRDLHPGRRCGAGLRRQGRGRHGRHQRADPGADRLLHVRRLEGVRLRRPQPARPGLDPLLHEDEDGHVALALRREGGRGVLDAADAVATARPECSPNLSAGLGPQDRERDGPYLVRERLRPAGRLAHRHANGFRGRGQPAVLRHDHLAKPERGAAEMPDPGARAGPAWVVQLRLELDRELRDHEVAVAALVRPEARAEQVHAAALGEDGEHRVVDVAVQVRVAEAEDILHPGQARIGAERRDIDLRQGARPRTIRPRRAPSWS
jgi:malonate-semialdehyde dehydrogenase (acetylating)/methylmalonate-semialdehyde dehydrogenase